jgi:hypothetical protein
MSSLFRANFRDFCKPFFLFCSQKYIGHFNFTFTIFCCREGRGGHSRHDWAGGHGRNQGHQVPSRGQVQPQVGGAIVRIRGIKSLPGVKSNPR